MATQQEFKGISARAKAVLGVPEGLDVEFKESLAGLDASDIVAFANSDSGGVILVGVRELKGPQGAAAGTIVGCKVDDRAKQSLLGKSESCTPPVPIEVFIENSAAAAFFRIEIPSGAHKPYCTSGGTYKIRGDGRCKALHPGLMLSMFVEKESHQFLERFRNATRQLEFRVDELKDDLLAQLHQLDVETGQFRQNVEGTLDDVGRFAEEASSESEVASSLAGEIHDRVEGISGDVNSYGSEMDAKLNAILLHLGIPDPNVDNKEWLLVHRIWATTRDGLTLDEAMTALSVEFPAGTPEQMERIRVGASQLGAEIQASVVRIEPPSSKPTKRRRH